MARFSYFEMKINHSFVCHIGGHPRAAILDALEQLDTNGWPPALSNDLPDDFVLRLDIISSSTWGLYFFEQSKDNQLAQLELGMLLASPEVRQVALIGVIRPWCLYLNSSRKVYTYSSWENFAARNFIP
jgi:hypothetical protein